MAQDNQGDKQFVQPSEEQLQAIKIGWLTKKLELTPDEAQKFWPIYNQYTDEVKKARLDNDKRDPLEFEGKLLDIRKRFKQQFSRAISGEKINKFWVLEHQFDNAVMKEGMRRKMLQRRRG